MKTAKYRGPRLARFKRGERRVEKFLRRLTAGLKAGLTSPSRPWIPFSIVPDNRSWARVSNLA